MPSKKLERLIPEERPWYTEIDIIGISRPRTQRRLRDYAFLRLRRPVAVLQEPGEAIATIPPVSTYVLEWEPDSVRWYIDDQLIHASVVGIPHTPHYLILNTAIGGSAGQPGLNDRLPAVSRR
jgi:hypothetical protein